MADHTKILAVIANSTDPDKLRVIQQHAKDKGVTEVKDAAFERLIEILPKEKPGTIEHDFWKTIHMFEEILREERGKTVRLSRTRQKINRVGVMQTMIDLAIRTLPSEGFTMLIERQRPELTCEALVIKHEASFDLEVLTAARKRLSDAQIDISKLPF